MTTLAALRAWWRTAAAVLIAVVLPALGLAPAAAGEAPPEPPPAGRVVVVGVAGLTWDAVDAAATPALWRLTSGGAAGVSSIRSQAQAPCPTEAWLALGAGNRASGPDPARRGVVCSATTPGPPPGVDPEDRSVRVPGLDRARPANDALPLDLELGALGSALAGAGRCATAIGPGAALAASTAEGQLAGYGPALEQTDDETLGAALDFCDVTVLELDYLSAEDGSGDGTGDDTGNGTGIAAVDEQLARVDALRPAGSTLLVVGAGAIGADPAPRLQVAVENGPAAAPGRVLVSPSTRHAPHVQLVDVAPTVLERLGEPRPATMIGQPWSSTGGSRPPEERVAALSDVDRHAVRHRSDHVPVVATVIAVQVLVLGGLAALAGLRPARRPFARRAARVAGVVGAAAPAGTYLANLVPWWRADASLPLLLAASAVGCGLIAALALLGPWRRDRLGPVGVVAGLTATILAADVVAGSNLQMSAVLGHSPLVAGRFSGLSNLAFGVFAAAVLIAAAVAAAAVARAVGMPGDRRAAGATAGGIGVVAVVVVGAPDWGSDIGGVLSLVPAVVLLVLLVRGSRVSVLRLALALAAGAAVVAALALADAQRPEAQRTHLGRFVDSVRDGGAATVLRRKAEANLDLLTATPLNLAVPLLLALALALVLRPASLGLPAVGAALRREPALRAGLLAVLTTAVVGAVVNDSGVAVVATVLLVAAPLAVAGVLAADADRRRVEGEAGGPVLPSTPVDRRAGPVERSGEHAPRRHGEVPG